MELSYKVSEKQYLEAMKLKVKTAARAGVRNTVMFWVFILVCLFLLWTIVSKNSQPHSIPDYPPPQHEIVNTVEALRDFAINFSLFVLLIGIWLFILLRLGPKAARRQFHKDPSMQGQFTVEIAPSGVEIRNTAGTFATAGWNIYEFWREGSDLIILGMYSGAYLILSLTELPEPQRAELRGILQTALPKR